MVVAVVGSRRGSCLDDVTAFLSALHRSDPFALIVSGGAAGVDKTAEQEWLRLGSRVVSLRPRNIPVANGDSEWWVERWTLPNGTVETLRDVSFADFSGAALYRNMLIVEYSSRVVAFQSDPPSPGTRITCGFAKQADKPLYVYSPRDRFGGS